ncbi:DEAD/DEAH box helicase family protein [Paraclostridium bifermentans]|uniref:DEAD/DEAH box helicase family protein n=1 Tax=Paraclostridium bifermentans TaxID=1490 RepID=UPI00241C8452|nr:DEAD/DEAH box helicase family protein [Paraclostridium bifermentans]
MNFTKREIDIMTGKIGGNIVDTLTDVWRKKNFSIWKNTLNLIVSPTGSGKTYFVFNELINKYNNNEVIYLCDTSNLEEAVRKDEVYSHLLKYRNEKKEISQFGILRNGFETKIEVMTYAKFGYDLNNDPNCFDDKKLIICDEAHNLIKYRNRYDRENNKIYTDSINKLNELTKKMDVVLLTATPYGIIADEDFKNFNMRTINFEGIVRNLYSRKMESFGNVKNLISSTNDWMSSFNAGYKGLIYTDNIRNSVDLAERFKKLGLNAVPLWSLNNAKYPMTNYQLEVRKEIIETGKVPMEVDAIIINGAYETGINIKDKRVDMVIVNNSNKDIIKQVRGRIRHNITLLLYKSNEVKNGLEDMEILLDEKWLNRNLTKKDKDELVNELDLSNGRNKQVKWTSIKKLLEQNKYTIIDKMARIQGKPTKVSIITR